MPNRIIKDSIRTSKTVNGMTDFQFRLWVYLITYVDDYGRGSADPELLKGFVFPRRKGVTESTIEKALADLANSGSVLLYEVDGEPYFCFPNWGDHQRIQTKKSKYPAPDSEKSRWVTVGHGELPPESNPNPNTNPNPKENSARKHKYGEYENVLLSDEELEKLKAEFPDWKQRIERLSAYKASTGKAYKNDLATIRNWAKRDNESKPAKPVSYNMDAINKRFELGNIK